MRKSFEWEWWKDRDGNLTVPILTAANLLVIDMERRGVVLAADEHGNIIARPTALITDEDRHTIRALKPFVRQVLNYQPPTVH